MTALRIPQIGAAQSAALWQELLESIHAETGDRFPGALVGHVLTIEEGGFDGRRTWRRDLSSPLHKYSLRYRST